MSNAIRSHQDTQELTGQINELIGVGTRRQRGVEKMRSMVACLLTEHKHETTDEFRKYHVYNGQDRNEESEFDGVGNEYSGLG